MSQACIALARHTGVRTALDRAGRSGGEGVIGMLLGRDVRACGFSRGLERMIAIMTERNMFRDSLVQGGVDVMVALWNDDVRADALALAADFRRAGLRVEIYPDADKLG